MEFKLIPAGTFIMGEGDQAHEVTLTKPFKMGVHEVTQAQYEQVMGVNPSKYKGADNPVETVSWEDAVEFCRKLSELPAEKAAGNVYRLPTEAEWEYACRAGTTTKYSFGDDESDLRVITVGTWTAPTASSILAINIIQWVVSNRMLGACTICMAMFGSGVRIGRKITLKVP